MTFDLAFERALQTHRHATNRFDIVSRTLRACVAVNAREMVAMAAAKMPPPLILGDITC